MKLIWFTTLLILSIFTIFSREPEAGIIRYSVRYIPEIKTLEYEVTLNTYFDKRGEIRFTKPSANYTVTSIRVFRGKKRLFVTRQLMKRDVILKNRDERYKRAVVKINYQDNMMINHPYLLVRNFLFSPFAPIEVGEKNIVESYLVDFIVPEDWILLAPYESDVRHDRQEKELHYTLSTDGKRQIVFLAGKRLSPHFRKSAGGREFLVYGRKYLKRLFSRYESSEGEIVRRFNSLLNYIETILGRSISEEEYRLLLVGFINLSFEVDGANLVSVTHFKALLKEREQLQIYDILHDFTLKYTAAQIKAEYLERDYWIAEGIAHFVAANYFFERYELNLNYMNGNPFIHFLLGEKRSRYALSTSIFREQRRYNGIKRINENNRSRTGEYTYRARAINDHYSLQIFYNLKNLVGRERLKSFIGELVSYDSHITTAGFLNMVKSRLGFEEYEIMYNLIHSYPKVDYQLIRRGGEVFIRRNRGELKLPLEVELVYKSNIRRRFVLLIDQKETRLEINTDNLRNIILDPDGLLEEVNEANNFYVTPVHFSFISPTVKNDTYNLALSGLICNYNDVTLGGGTIAGGWNMAGFTNNTISKPNLLWGFDLGYGYNDEEVFRDLHNFFINAFFESSVYPLSAWAPRFYSYFFWLTGESFSMKIGLQGFIPPVVNTEYDELHFNHSWDSGFDVKFRYYPYGTVDFNLNAGYRAFFRWKIFTTEAILAVNFDFDRIAPKDINLGFHFNSKFDFHIFELGFRPGILYSFFPYKRYEFDRPKFTRFSLVTQSVGFYEQISKNLVYANNLIKDFPYPQMNFYFFNTYLMFKFNILKEPLLDPRLSLGIGAFVDFLIPLPYNQDRVRAIFAGATIKIDIMKKTSIILRGTFLPLYFIRNEPAYRIENPLQLIFYEIRAYF